VENGLAAGWGAPSPPPPKDPSFECSCVAQQARLARACGSIIGAQEPWRWTGDWQQPHRGVECVCEGPTWPPDADGGGGGARLAGDGRALHPPPNRPSWAWPARAEPTAQRRADTFAHDVLPINADHLPAGAAPYSAGTVSPARAHTASGTASTLPRGAGDDGCP